MSGIAGQARYEGFGGKIVVWVEFWLSTRKRLSEKQGFIEKPKAGDPHGGQGPAIPHALGLPATNAPVSYVSFTLCIYSSSTPMSSVKSFHSGLKTYYLV